jgi:hypothetical protein
MAVFRATSSHLVLQAFRRPPSSFRRPFPFVTTPSGARSGMLPSTKPCFRQPMPRNRRSVLTVQLHSRLATCTTTPRLQLSRAQRLAAAAVNKNLQDVSRFEKLAEGRFSRSFLVTMHVGFQLVTRIPYTFREPRQLFLASEVATLRSLKTQGLPVLQVYSYSTTAENEAGTEYVFMELVKG